MPVHTRDGKVVINLTGNWHDPSDPSLLTTTRNYFTRDDFLAVRAGIQKLEGTSEGAEALNRLKAGESLSPVHKDLLRTNLGSFAENQNAVNGVAGWVKGHGTEIPEAILRQGEHPIFPEQMSAVATALSERLGAEKAGAALNTMRDITAGKPVSAAARSAAMKAFEDAGLLTAQGELTSVGVLTLKQEGARFLASAGIITAEGAKTASRALDAVTLTASHAPGSSLPMGLAGAGEKLAAGETVATEASLAGRIAREAAEGARLVRAGTGIALKKIPIAGQAIAAGAAIMSIVGAAHAETLPPEPPSAPQTAEEKKAREILEMQAATQRTDRVSQEVVKGMLGLLPVPGLGNVFDAYADNEREKMQSRPGAGRPLEVDGLVQQPGSLDRAAPINAHYNAQAQGLHNHPATPAVVLTDGGALQPKTRVPPQ
jgi:hypothetical protein